MFYYKSIWSNRLLFSTASNVVAIFVLCLAGTPHYYPLVTSPAKWNNTIITCIRCADEHFRCQLLDGSSSCCRYNKYHFPCVFPPPPPPSPPPRPPLPPLSNPVFRTWTHHFIADTKSSNRIRASCDGDFWLGSIMAMPMPWAGITIMYIWYDDEMQICLNFNCYECWVLTTLWDELGYSQLLLAIRLISYSY